MIAEIEMLEAQEFACEHYNIPRREFMELAAVKSLSSMAKKGSADIEESLWRISRAIQILLK